MADHNDPNAVNSAFSDIDVSAADLYDLFGFPVNSEAGSEKVYIALTFASVPKTGVLDSDILYRLQIHAAPRVAWPDSEGRTLESLLKYVDGVKQKYLGNFKASEIRVNVDSAQQVHVKFLNFHKAGNFSVTLDTNKVKEIKTPDGQVIKAYIGERRRVLQRPNRFFRSINYAPQFYHVPHTMPEARELPIPKTLLELEGNDLFNFDPANPPSRPRREEGSAARALHLEREQVQRRTKGKLPLRLQRSDCQAGKTSTRSSGDSARLSDRARRPRTASSTPGAKAGCCKASNKVDDDSGHPFWLENPRRLASKRRARTTSSRVQAGRHRRASRSPTPP